MVRPKAALHDPHAVGHPRFRLRWLIDRDTTLPEWLHDDEWVPPGESELYARVKHGLYEALGAANREGPVLLPAYVPGGVTRTVREAGYDVRYYPVNGDLTLPVDGVRDRIADTDPAAVVFVHYFGFVDDGYDELREIARDRDTLVIEDCARGLFSRDRQGRLLGSTGDVALFCLHKTLPVPNGGLVITRHAGLPSPTVRRVEWKSIPRVAMLWLARHSRVALDAAPSIERRTNRALESVSAVERSYAPGPISRRGLAHTVPAAVQSARRNRYHQLRGLLVDDTDLRVVTPEAHDDASPYGVAALASNAAARERHLHALRSHGLPADVLTWPPVYRHDEAMTFEGANTLRNRLLILPTHQQLGPESVSLMADYVGESTGGSS